jgi:hypothetical protein
MGTSNSNQIRNTKLKQMEGRVLFLEKITGWPTHLHCYSVNKLIAITKSSRMLFINMYSCVDGENPIAGARY